MKRSEMLEIIANALPAHEYWGTDYDSAARVLKAVEDAGMKPPWNNTEFQKQARTLISPEGYGWEPEDEHQNS